MVKIYKRYFIWLTLTFFVISGCAHIFKDTKSEESLRERVQKEWTAKKAGEWGTVYDLASKGFKNQVSRDKFIQRANLNVEGFSVEEIEVDSEQGKAWAKVTFDILQMGFPLKGLTLKEEWIWEDGEWRLNLDLNLKRTPFD